MFLALTYFGCLQLVVSPPVISTGTFITVLRMLSVMCANCPDLALTLLRQNIAETLCYLLTGSGDANMEEVLLSLSFYVVMLVQLRSICSPPCNVSPLSCLRSRGYCVFSWIDKPHQFHERELLTVHETRS
jgi:hypothetical protein